MIKGFKLISVFTFISTILMSQTAFVNISNRNIYDFLDEMANEKIITINSTIKPYSRIYILEKLEEAYNKEVELSIRQLEELDFYLNEYKFDKQASTNPISQKAKLNVFKRNKAFATSINPLGFFYKDSLFSISVKPIWGAQFYINKNDTIRHNWGGAEMYANIGKHVSFYASLRDNQVTKMINYPQYFTDLKGGAQQEGKSIAGGADFNEMIGGITYSWKWGDVGVVKENIVWGDNYHGSNIFSDRTPSFAMVKLHMNPVSWFDFNYYHGWLVSEVIDSIKSYVTTSGDNRLVYRKKFLAANMFTFIPVPGLNISFGNSIIYSDMDFNPAYLIPVFFYKSVDHTYNHSIDNQNSQMFGNISMRLIKHWHFYSSLFIDELQVSRMFNKNRHNFYSFKTGSRLSNWPIRNVFLTAEYTKTSPITFKHRVPTLQFESNQYNLGHYLVDNSAEFFSEVLFKPVCRLKIKMAYIYAIHGNEYSYALNGKNKIDENPVLKDITWKNESWQYGIDYEVFNNGYLFVNMISSNINGYNADGHSAQYYLNLFTPEFLHGKNLTINAGFNVGF